MLLSEEIENNIYTSYFQSSNVLVCQYDNNIQILGVIFKGGRQYLYENISDTEYQGLKISDSKGTFIQKKFKNKKYKFVGKIADIEGLLEKIEKLKNERRIN